ncbi:cytochrome b-c1 complex subunit 6, mitochondrial-like [Actinia tenebrosa]|uniref:Cytochrome b-c1 complex subunit 6, mitochondrial-like n=1 Tax=Actinia tenebrosa TaxID=6105 RepID=A0A6P8HS37_ACTTE|nr:cytochrome b-c1 complex subunit 6, mitochondrial-like [Actinia tenebrosa]
MAVGNENEVRDEELVEETVDDPDPEEEAQEEGEQNEEEEEEEEPETEDPMDKIRETCEELSECVKLKAEYDTCTERVNSKSKTTETCAQELLEFLHCRDHCVSKSIFNKVK